ncbi:hypothetical protein ABVK80_14520, partial [Vibrio cholerae]
MKHLIKNYVQKLIKTELDAIQSKSVHDNRNFIYNGEFLILESEFGWHCFPRVQLNHALSYKNPNFGECKNICVSGILNLLKGNTECQYQTN